MKKDVLFDEESSKITSEIKARLWEKQRGRCFYCGIDTNPFNGKATRLYTTSIDHKIPKNRGGSHEYENLAIACMRCNSQKNNKTIDEYRVFLSSKRAIFSDEQLKILEKNSVHLPSHLREPEKVVFFGEENQW